MTIYFREMDVHTLQIILMVLLVGSHATTDIKHSLRPSRRLDVVNPSLVTTTVASFQDCIKTCQRWTSCLVANYRKRGHICSLLHRTGEKEAVFDNTKKAGVWSWKKPKINEIDNSCLSCDRAKACAVDPVHGTCTVSACEDPKMFGTKRAHGNLRTVGSKVAFECFNHTAGEMLLHVIECSRDGTWSNAEKICGYTEHVIEGETVLLKVVEVEVNQTTALSNCGNEGASLVTMLNIGKMEYMNTFLEFNIIFGSMTASPLWMDVQKQDGKWYVSDGRSQLMDTTYIWNGSKLWPDPCACNCAVLKKGSVWWSLEPQECERMYDYICEIVVR